MCSSDLTASNVTFNVTGAVTVSGAIGTDIGTVTVTNSGGITFQSTVNAANVALTNTTGNIQFNDNLTVGTSLTTAAQAYNVILQGASNTIAGATTFANTGSVTIGNDATDTNAFTGGLVHTAGATNLAGSISATNAAMTFAATTLSQTTSIDSDGGNILFSSTLAGGGNDLTIAAGTAAGTTTFTGAVSGLGDGVGAALTLASTGLVRFMSTVGAASGISSTNASGSTRFDGDVTLTNGDTGSTFTGTTTLDEIGRAHV